jgi:hypothetical protein
MSRPPDRVIDCRDLAGRRHHLIVFTDHGRIILVVPAGETAVLTLTQAGRLRASLRDAIAEAAGASR